MNSISIKMIKEDIGIFSSLYEIYKASFPLSEQKSEDTIRNVLSRSDYAVFLLEKDQKAAGFAIYFRPADAPFYLLEYMAIDPAQRSGGLGNHLFIHSVKNLIGEFGTKPVWIEIDTPSRIDMTAPEHRRERFYRNAGCKRVMGFKYILGLKTAHTPPPMSLMVFAPDRSTIAKEELRLHVETIYQQVYGRFDYESEMKRMFQNTDETLKLI